MTTRPFVVKSSAAKMPNSCWGQYRHVALIETSDGRQPAMISERARGVVRIVEMRRNCNVGRKIRSAYVRAMDELTAQAKILNDQHEAKLLQI